MGLCHAVSTGALFGGSKPVEQGDVLLLDLEGNRRRAQKRFRMIRNGDEPSDALEIAHEWPRMDQGGLELIRDWAKSKRNPQLVVVDIWVRFRPPRPKNADPYQYDYDCMKLLHQLAHELGVAIVVVHHNRKAADADWINEIGGSQGTAGAADTLLVICVRGAKPRANLRIAGGLAVLKLRKRWLRR
jgi:RecA-family ATPase